MSAKPSITSTTAKRERRAYKIMGGLLFLLALLTAIAALGPRAREGASPPRSDPMHNHAYSKLRH
jgi:hypothetical protein